MDSDDGTGGEDVLNQDPLPLDENLDKKSRKSNKKSKEEIKALKQACFGQAFEAFMQGVYPSVNSCALTFNVNHKTLGWMITSNRQYIGGVRKSVAFTAEEEAKLVNFVSQMLFFGCGLDFSHWSAPLTSQIAAAPVTEAGGGSDLNFREDSLSVKKQKIKRYEMIMLEPLQLAYFEDLFKKEKRFDVKNHLRLSWLPLKLAAVGNKQEAFDFILQERTLANVPKQITKRKVSQPTGAARINPQSQEYKTIFRERIESEKRLTKEKSC